LSQLGTGPRTGMTWRKVACSRGRWPESGSERHCRPLRRATRGRSSARDLGVPGMARANICRAPTNASCCGTITSVRLPMNQATPTRGKQRQRSESATRIESGWPLAARPAHVQAQVREPPRPTPSSHHQDSGLLGETQHGHPRARSADAAGSYRTSGSAEEPRDRIQPDTSTAGQYALFVPAAQRAQQR